MISIITCSIKPELCQKMLDSVRNTIGTDYEEIVFDNREKNYGICKAYNEAAKKSNGDYLCFVHEDIIIKTENWGKKIIEFSKKTENTGAIGIAGGRIFSIKNFIGWFSCSEKYFKVFQVDKNTNYSIESFHCDYYNPNNELFTKVDVLDGVFIFVKREIWLNNNFDEETFKGFHFYDADFTFNISLKYQNYVYFGMDIYHYSSGNLTKQFFYNMFLFQNKWKYIKKHFFVEIKSAYNIYKSYINFNCSIYECFLRIYKMNGLFFLSILLIYLFYMETINILYVFFRAIYRIVIPSSIRKIIYNKKINKE